MHLTVTARFFSKCSFWEGEGSFCLALSILQSPIGNCLLQCLRRWLLTCRQNATVATQRLVQSRRVTELTEFSVLETKPGPNDSHMRKRFSSKHLATLPLFCSVWTKFSCIFKARQQWSQLSTFKARQRWSQLSTFEAVCNITCNKPADNSTSEEWVRN